MGKITVTGIGPGSIDMMAPKAKKAIEEADIVTGYTTYIKLIEKHFPGKEFLSTGMMQEVDRCNICLDLALEGKKIVMVSSGDPGVYGMAGLMLEIADNTGVDVEIIPGITAANAAAAVLGAPLMNDFAVISLSDLLTPMEVIENRIECAAKGDLVINLYNPKSKKRVDHLKKAVSIILKYRSADTPCGVVKNAFREGEEYYLTRLDRLPEGDIDMFSVVIIGNSQTKVLNNKLITSRGYKF